MRWRPDTTPGAPSRSRNRNACAPRCRARHAWQPRLADALKGTVAVIVVKYFTVDPTLPLAAGLGAFIGHLFPVWLGFKGGKGVATYIGILFALSWPVAIGFCLVWVAIAALTRYSSLAGLTASGLTPVALWFNGQRPETLLFAVLTLLLWFRH